MLKPCRRGHTTGRYKDGSCKECSKITAAAWSKSNKQARNAIVRKHSWKSQRIFPTYESPGYCECCFRPQVDFKKALHADHCHVTGEFRGWLCASCNMGIGSLGDSIDGIEKAKNYLQKRVA